MIDKKTCKGLVLLKTNIDNAVKARTGSIQGLKTDRSKLLRTILENWQVYLMLIPVLAYYIIFHYGPMYGLQIAFKDYNPVLGFWSSPWRGFDHFKRFFSSYNATRTIGNTITLSLLSLVISFPLTIIHALMLHELRSQKFKRMVQTITYAPHFISVVVVISMMVLFTHPERGVINFAINALGGETIRFMEKPEWFRPLYIISGLWQELGYGAIIYIAALSGIDQELLEAASIDGAGRLRRIWHINIPGILPTVITMLILRVGGIMTIGHEKVFLMQNPLNLEKSEIISTYTYRVGIINNQMSFASAVTLFNSVINFLLLVSVNKLSKHVSETSLW
ncbi:MAG: sugar ABC transporter permease [Clostridiales bacterium]|nr:sugar ABC transporter permease [Clostridiales bacterium]